MPSPRQTLLASLQACLVRIQQADGYNTDAGSVMTLEPDQVDADATAVLYAIVAAQARASEVALVRTHRLTTVGIVAKVPTKLANAQAQLDAIVTDIEAAMADQQFRFPVGIQAPQYQSMEPINPAAGMAWIGALLTYTTHIPIR